MNTSFSLSDLDPRKWSPRTWFLFIVALIALVLLLVGCSQQPSEEPEPTTTATAESDTAVTTDTPTLASTDTPMPTEAPSSTPTSTAVPSPTSTPEPSATATLEWECPLEDEQILNCLDTAVVTKPADAPARVTGATAFVGAPTGDLMETSVVIPVDTLLPVYWQFQSYFGVFYGGQNYWISQEYATLQAGNEIPAAEEPGFWTAETETAEVAASPVATTEGTPESTAVAGGPTVTPTPGPCSGSLVGQDDGAMREDSRIQVSYSTDTGEKSANVTITVPAETGWKVCLSDRQIASSRWTQDGNQITFAVAKSLDWVPDVNSHGVWLLDADGRVRAATSLWLGD